MRAALSDNFANGVNCLLGFATVSLNVSLCILACPLCLCAGLLSLAKPQRHRDHGGCTDKANAGYSAFRIRPYFKVSF